MKHTNAPWCIIPSCDDGESFSIFNPGTARVICNLTDSWDDIRRISYASDEDRANARLIAAAPDLLAVCEELLEQLQCDYGEDARELAINGCSRWQFAVDVIHAAKGNDYADCPESVKILRIAHGI